MVKHVDGMTTKPIPIHQCGMCDRLFLKKAYLKKHHRTHTGEKPFQCDVCNRSFAQASDLTKHMRTHTGEKPYSCDVCDLSFSEISNLKRHLRIHSKVRPYFCTLCNVDFTQTSHYSAHVQSMKHKRAVKKAEEQNQHGTGSDDLQLPLNVFVTTFENE